MSDFLAVVSDTHGQVQFARRAVRLLEPFEPRCLIHCGDIGSPAIPEVFAGFDAHYVLGNFDHYDEPELAAAIAQAGQYFAGRFGELTLLDKKIAWLHGDDERLRLGLLRAHGQARDTTRRANVGPQSGCALSR
jgi:uncharacterized protein